MPAKHWGVVLRLVPAVLLLAVVLKWGFPGTGDRGFQIVLISPARHARPS